MSDKNKKILVVEDTPAIGKAVSMGLQSAGFKVDLCTNEKDGLQKILNHDYDLVILDLVMPGKTGFDLMNELGMLKKHVPIMVYSSMAEQMTKEEALKLGAVDYLEKSTASLDTLISKVSKITNS